MSETSEAGMGEKAGGPGASATGAASAGDAATDRDVTIPSHHNTPENPSIVLATTVLTALISQGVRWVAYCPGSRDAPFGYALANLERSGSVRAAVFSDERSAGFWAVGAAKLHHEPVAVVTTSGTAVAELHPALEEAWFQSLPVIALTADRPHELRGVGASQTTHQVGIFGRSVVASDELPAEDSYDAVALARVRGRVRRIVAASRGFLGQAGPVHLNVAFREPLVPVASSLFRCGAREISPSQLLQPSSVIESRARHSKWGDVVRAGLRTLVVAGDGADPAVAAAAARRGIPVIAEPSSNVTGVETWIPYEQWIVPQLGRDVEQIVVTGRPTLSRPITQLLGQAGIRKVVVAAHPEWVDVHETADVVVEGLADDVGLADRRDCGVGSRKWQLGSTRRSVQIPGCTHGARLQLPLMRYRMTRLWLPMISPCSRPAVRCGEAAAPRCSGSAPRTPCVALISPQTVLGGQTSIRIAGSLASMEPLRRLSDSPWQAGARSAPSWAT